MDDHFHYGMALPDDSFGLGGNRVNFVTTPNDSDDMKLTAAEQALLSLLREDARASTAQIARRLGLSRTTVQSRSKSWNSAGDPRLHRARARRSGTGPDPCAHLITVLPRHAPAVVKALQASPQVRSLHRSAARTIWWRSGAAPTVGEIDVLTDRIGGIDGVERTTSSIILSTKFER
jgi:DNA-binding Lrp family transcriptional regulator